MSEDSTMQVTETLTEGLKREYRVVVPLNELDAKVNERLEDLKDKVRINGFRPGKVPVAHLKRVYGRSVMAEAIEAAVRDTNAKIITDNGFKLAMEPRVNLPTDEEEVKSMVEGKTDLAYSVTMEILPKITLADFKGIEIDKLSADVADTEVDEALGKIAEQNRPFEARAEGAGAEKGDKVTVSFIGRIDGTAFEGGTGDDVAVEIGSNTFIPGFEDQLIGIKVGETRTIKATFPEGYMKAELAGKEAEFETTAKEIAAPGTVTVDDAFASQLGIETLDKLKDAIRDRIAREHSGASRQKLKRALLDALDERHKFDLPPTLLEEEFNNVWKTVEDDLKAQGRTFADEGMKEDEVRGEYRKIAERRVRLGLVIAEIGEKNNIQVTNEEVRRALLERASQFPGQERQVYEFYQSNPQALASLRAPIFEDKVIDFLCELVKVNDKKVTREELYKEDEEARAA
jgi:trigger factor